jgi:membrane-bound ClpP family serine protease
VIGIFLIVLGLILWLATGWNIVGIVLIVLGIFLMFAPGPWYGYSHYRGRRGPPV